MVIEEAKRVLKVEAEAILGLIEKVGEQFSRAVDLIHQCRGKVVITGMGKSGLVCKKIASTFASYGTPAFFLHPAEGSHGDLGMLVKDDLVIGVSNSGETDEITRLLPLIKRMGIRLIAMTGNLNSSLARAADVVLDIGVKEEACPLGLAPTASTTATMAMGDALAIAVLNKRGFREEDFALLHPGGVLGRRLLLRVSDLMHTGEQIPMVSESTLMRDTIYVISSKRLGVTGVADGDSRLVGVITDGDLRRALEKGGDILNKEARQVMAVNPKRICKDQLAAQALRMMEEYAITSLFVHEEGKEDRAVGIIHMHDLVKAGMV